MVTSRQRWVHRGLDPLCPVRRARSLQSLMRRAQQQNLRRRTNMTERKDLLTHELGENDCAAILQGSLREEEAMAKFIEQNAPKAPKKLLAKSAK